MLYEIRTSGSDGNVILKKKFTNGRTDEGRRPITIVRLEPSAQVS